MSAPDYYQIKIPESLIRIEDGFVILQPWDLSYALGHGYTRGAIDKYGLRAGSKPGVPERVDLMKCRDSIDRRLREIEREEEAKRAAVAAKVQGMFANVKGKQ